MRGLVDTRRTRVAAARHIMCVFFVVSTRVCRYALREAGRWLLPATVSFAFGGDLLVMRYSYRGRCTLGCSDMRIYVREADLQHRGGNIVVLYCR